MACGIANGAQRIIVVTLISSILWYHQLQIFYTRFLFKGFIHQDFWIWDYLRGLIVLDQNLWIWSEVETSLQLLHR